MNLKLNYAFSSLYISSSHLLCFSFRLTDYYRTTNSPISGNETKIVPPFNSGYFFWINWFNTCLLLNAFFSPGVWHHMHKCYKMWSIKNQIPKKLNRNCSMSSVPCKRTSHQHRMFFLKIKYKNNMRSTRKQTKAHAAAGHYIH